MTAQQPAVKRYVVKLGGDERDRLNALIQKGKAPARQVLKARILLKADASDAGEGWSDSQIAAALDTSTDTVARTRQQLVEGGIDAALTRKHSPNSARKRIFDGAAEAKLIALACSPPPKGHARWTLTLLESAVVELNIVDRASDNTIGRTLKKTRSSRICRSNGSSRRRPMPASQPPWRTCWRFTSGRTIRTAPSSAWTRRPSNSSRKPACQFPPSRDNWPATTPNMSATAPPTWSCCSPRSRAGGRFEVTDRHAACDYAQVLRDLSDRHFPSAARIVLVQDNLSTHKSASLYEAFPAAEARRLVERFEWHYTPRHGSWLDMAESELSVLSRQCLDRRIPDKPTLIEEVAAWQEERNRNHAKADWQFTTADARVKLKRLYPVL